MIKNINYANKQAFQNDEDIPENQKVTDQNMNEIKEIVNNNAKELDSTQKKITTVINAPLKYKGSVEQFSDLEKLENVNNKSVSASSEENTKGKKKEKVQKVVKWGPNRILQCFAYFSIMLIAISMIFRLIFKNQPDIVVYMQGIGECLAYIVCVWLGFYFTLKRGNIWWLVGWIVGTIILVVFYVFAIVP